MHCHNPVSNTEIFLSPLCIEDECALTGENSSCRFIHSTKWQHREPGLNPLASNRSRHSNVTNSPKRLFHNIYQAVHTALDHPKIILLFPLYHSQQRKETIQVQSHLEIQSVTTGEWIIFHSKWFITHRRNIQHRGKWDIWKQ